MTRYVFRELITIKNAAKADPQKIGEALDAIRRDAGGRLEPQRVWQTARADKAHPLHQHFEWDVNRVAEAYWTDQARSLIRAVHIVNDVSGEAEIAFFSVSDKTGVSYRSNDDVKSSTDLRRAVLLQAERDLEAWERRYRLITDALKLVKSARAKVRKRREAMEARP
jgi:hypothetical protein